MGTDLQTGKKKIYRVQVHIIHSLLQMIKTRLKHHPGMKEAEFMQANALLFQRIADAVQQSYNLDYSTAHALQAARLYLNGLQ